MVVDSDAAGAIEATVKATTLTEVALVATIFTLAVSATETLAVVLRVAEA